MRARFLAVALLLVPTTAWGLTVEPGSIIGSAALGPGFRLGSALGASGAYLLVNAQGEYAFDKSLSAVAGLNLGVSGSVPLRLRAGARYRLADLDLPVSPFAQAQLSFGRIWDVIGANLTTLGAYLGAGADYFLTAKLSVGGQVGVDLSTTMGQRPAFLGMVEIVAFGSYVF